jgi:ergothioneine biosynthesis protein EgtB
MLQPSPAGVQTASRIEPFERLERAWARSDLLFSLLTRDAVLEQPIPLRQPFLFYLGHLPAFASQHLWRGVLGKGSLEPRLDELFARGIDPVGVDAYQPQLHWPGVEHVLDYRERIREALRGGWGGGDSQAILMVLEHELMHHETLLYMVQQLPRGKKHPPSRPDYLLHGGVSSRALGIPGGKVTLGASEKELPFGWDNEFPEHEVGVAPFEMDSVPVDNGAFFEFVEAGGYLRRELWSEESWAWRARRDLRHPLSWSRGRDGWLCETLFDQLSLPEVASWPVFVSLAEARAFARWRGARLPTEAEFHRAAYGTPEGHFRPHPWGEAPPGPQRGNFDFNHWAPTPVGSHPEGRSAFGVFELVGNGWEWTESPFAPFPGFRPMPRYPRYSQDFFDGAHFVLLGASFSTDASLIRRSFRNWFQPHYPYVFAKFRCVRGA